MKIYAMAYQQTRDHKWRVGLSLEFSPGLLFTNQVYQTEQEAEGFVQNAQFEIVRVVRCSQSEHSSAQKQGE